MNDREREIGARVRSIREQIRWSQSDFAAALDITRNRLVSIEYGITPLPYVLAWRIHERFGISLEWLEEGFGVPDARQTRFPPPHALQCSNRELLTEVYDRIQGPEFDPPLTHKQQLDLLAFATHNLASLSDIKQRIAVARALELRADLWLSAVPPGHVDSFEQELNSAAASILGQLPKRPQAQIDECFDEIHWERIRIAVAKKTFASRLTHVTELGNNSDVKTPMAHLLVRLNKATQQRGMKSKLARAMGVPLPNVSQWLSGEREPGGDTTLRLLKWVEQQEQK